MKRLFSCAILLSALVLGATPASAQGEIVSVEPSSGVKGTSIVLTIRGDAGLVFNENATVQLQPSGLACTGVTLWESNEIRCDLNIFDDVSTGLQDVYVTVTPSEYVAEGMFTILDPDAGSVSAIAPDTGRRGQTLDVTISGSNTDWTSESVLSFSPDDIDVLSQSVDSTTQISAQIQVGASASLSAHDVIVTTAGQDTTGSDLFTVEEQSVLLSPDSATQGDTVASITLTGGPGGYASVTDADLGEGVTVGSFSSADGSSLTLSAVVIAENSPVGLHDLELDFGNNTQTFAGVFAVRQGANTRLLAIDPAHGDAGHPALDLTVTGQNTHFDGADLDMIFSGEGVYFSHRVDADPELMTAQVWLRDDASSGLRDVEVRLGDAGCEACETVSLSQAFEVTAPGQILSVSPFQAEAGEELTISITASDGNFAAGQTRLFFEPEDGIQVEALRVTDADHAEADLLIAEDALGNARTLRATTGPEVAVGVEAFDVYSPSLRSILPTTTLQGTTGLTVTVEAIDVVFDSTVQIEFSGTGISSSAPQLDGEHPERFSVTVDVAEEAPATYRDVTISQGTLTLTAERAFRIIPKPTGEEGSGCGCASSAPVDPLVGLLLLLGLAAFARRRPR